MRNRRFAKKSRLRVNVGWERMNKVMMIYFLVLAATVIVYYALPLKRRWIAACFQHRILCCEQYISIRIYREHDAQRLFLRTLYPKIQRRSRCRGRGSGREREKSKKTE